MLDAGLAVGGCGGTLGLCCWLGTGGTGRCDTGIGGGGRVGGGGGGSGGVLIGGGGGGGGGGAEFT